MPIARKNTDREIPEDFLNQIKSNLKNKDETSEGESSTAVVLKTDTADETKKEKYADVMNVRLSKGKRGEIKSFCASCGISVTQYIESSFEFLKDEVESGRLMISKGGIKKL